jgi:hypothetical protein
VKKKMKVSKYKCENCGKTIQIPAMVVDRFTEAIISFENSVPELNYVPSIPHILRCNVRCCKTAAYKFVGREEEN